MFDEQTLLNNAVEAWQRHHRMTYSVLEQLTPEQLYAPLPRPTLNTFAKHFEEMADVQRAYAQAFHSGKLDFSMLSKDKPYSGVSTKDEIKAFMADADKRIFDGMAAASPDRAIDIFGMRGSRADLVQTLLHHELFHQGQFYIFSNALKFDLPKDWRDFWWIAPVYS
jgi:uncharacterized damage-inducible protein DinB